jgi:Na+/H+ antiporter NhaC
MLADPAVARHARPDRTQRRSVRRRRRTLLFAAGKVLLLLLLLTAARPSPAAQPILEFEVPPVAARDVDFTVKVTATGLEPGEIVPLTVTVGMGSAPLEQPIHDGSNDITLRSSGSGSVELVFHKADAIAHRASVRVLPGILSVLPPLLAILLAIIFRQVVVALLAAVWLGAWFVAGFDPVTATLSTVDRYALNALNDPGHASIILFTLMLGGMVAVISRSGGTHGIVERLRPLATTSRRGQVATWGIGMFIFFDDYANSLLVGNTMRPVADRLRISREKLAYIVDSTSAPIASVALISTWIGTEVGLIADSFDRLGIDADPYRTFVASIPYRFYPLLALVFVLLVAWSRRDYGPMWTAEARARRGQMFREGAMPLADPEIDKLRPPQGAALRWYNAVIPIGVVIVVTMAGLYVTGKQDSVEAAGLTLLQILGSGSPIRIMGDVISSGDSYQALMWANFLGSVAAVALAVGQRLLTLSDALEAWGRGVKAMMPAMVILILAWALSAVCADIQTAGYLVSAVSEGLPHYLLPGLVFVLAALVSFATGTSWGTMGILVPLTIPVAHSLGQVHHLGADQAWILLLGSISSVLAGAIFGDHCSPLSDTTILSSLASGSDHVDHVRTQLPYALTVAVVAVLLGDIPTAFGVSPWISLVVGVLLLYGILRLFGRHQVDVRL